MTTVRRELKRRRSTIALWMTIGSMTIGLVLVLPAVASHPEASLPGSNFEIDVDANLKVDDPPPSIDWAIGQRGTRRTTWRRVQNDDSYAGGAKEDDTCPGTTTGSIPNNKSDLLTFGAYVEPEADGPGFLHLFWTRVQEPNGTTLMDFELNKSSTDCGNGVNPVRTVGRPADRVPDRAGWRHRDVAGPRVGRVRLGAGAGPDGRGAGDRHDQQLADPGRASRMGSARRIRSARARSAKRQLDLDFILDEDECDVLRQRFPEEPSLGCLQLAAEGLHQSRCRSNDHQLRHGHHSQDDRPALGSEHDDIRLHEDLRHRSRLRGTRSTLGHASRPETFVGNVLFGSGLHRRRRPVSRRVGTSSTSTAPRVRG